MQISSRNQSRGFLYFEKLLHVRNIVVDYFLVPRLIHLNVLLRLLLVLNLLLIDQGMELEPLHQTQVNQLHTNLYDCQKPHIQLVLLIKLSQPTVCRRAQRLTRKYQQPQTIHQDAQNTTVHRYSRYGRPKLLQQHKKAQQINHQLILIKKVH